jgi:hypothetical protein
MTFWQLLLILAIFVPLIMLWVFTLVDLFNRRDLSGAAKALWAIAIVLLPLLAMLIYFIMRDSQSELPGTRLYGQAPPPPPQPHPIPASAADATVGADIVADQLERLADFHDRGILTDEEFQREKDKLLGSPPA